MAPLFEIQSITWNDKVYFGLKEKIIYLTNFPYHTKFLNKRYIQKTKFSVRSLKFNICYYPF